MGLVKLATMAATEIWRLRSGRRQPGWRPKQAAWPYFPSLGEGHGDQGHEDQGHEDQGPSPKPDTATALGLLFLGLRGFSLLSSC